MFCNCHTMESVWMGPADFRNASAMITRSDKSVKVATTLNKQDYHATISFKYIYLFCSSILESLFLLGIKILTATKMCILARECNGLVGPKYDSDRNFSYLIHRLKLFRLNILDVPGRLRLRSLF